MKLDGNNHSVLLLHYHLVMCIKHIRSVINDSISDRLKDVVKQYIENQGKK